jgi:hypothetical protein
MTIQINGMAHVMLTVGRYRELLPHFGMKPVFDGERLFYCVGGRTAIGIQPCDPAYTNERFVQQRVGLHHLCLRARSREDVDRLAAVLKYMHGTIIRGPEEVAGRPAITRCYSRTPTASAWNCASYRALGCWRVANRSIRLMATTNQEANGMPVRSSRLCRPP